MALSAKQQLFVDTYLATFNATQSALTAGYSDKTAYAQGARLLKNAEILEAIQARLDETAMSANEVLMRIAEHARGDIDDYLDDNGGFDLAKARRAAKTRLIKKFKTKTTVRTFGETEVETTEIEFELYDAQAALALLGKHHKLFVDRSELTGKDGGPIQTEQRAKPDLNKLSVDELLQLRQMVSKATGEFTNAG